MSREELVMDMIGELSDKFVAEALPKNFRNDKDAAKEESSSIRNVTFAENVEISKKDIRIYWITRALGMAAALALVVGGGVWLWKNWDKIAVSGNEKPGEATTVTTVSAPVITNDTISPDTTEPDTVDRFEQITDTSMPEPYDSTEYPMGNFDFGSLWQEKLLGTDTIVEFDYEKHNEHRKQIEGTETPYTLYDSANFYGLARAVELTDDEITEAIKKINEYYENSTNLMNNTSYIYTEEDISVIKNADEIEVARHFASDYSIVVGENVFSPRWLYYHTTEDYKAVGITPAMINAKLEKYRELGLTDEAWNAFRDKLLRYTDSEPENYGELKSYPVREDQVHTLFDERSTEIFANVFCGVWKCENEKVYPDELHLTYSEDYFDYGNACYPGSIVETDELYGLTYICGGELCCYTVFKNEPGVLYNCAYNLYNGSLEGYEWAVYINARAPKYTDHVLTEMPYLRAGKLSNLGQHRLKYEFGEDFAEFYHETLLHDMGYNGESYDGNGYIDENGTSWLVVSSMAYPRDTRYLVSYDNYGDEPSVTVGIPYYEKSEYDAHDYLGEDEEVSWKKYFALEFIKKDGKWQVTHRPLEDVYEEFDTLTFGAPEAQNKMTASLVCDNVQKIYGSVNFTSARLNVTDTVTGDPLAVTDFGTPLSGLDFMTSLGDPEVRIYSLQPGSALISVCLPLGDKQGSEYLPHLYWYDYSGLTGIDMTDSGTEFPEVTVKSPDDLTLSGCMVIHIIDSQSTEKWYRIGYTTEDSRVTGITVTESDCVGLTAADKARSFTEAWKDYTDGDVKILCGQPIPSEELSVFSLDDNVSSGKSQLDSLGFDGLTDLYNKGRFLMFINNDGLPQVSGYKGANYYSSELQEDGSRRYESDAMILGITADDGSISPYLSSGFTFDSFHDAYFKVFTDDMALELMNSQPRSYIKYGDELYYYTGISGSDISRIHTDYEIVSSTDDEVIMNAVCYMTMTEMDGVYDPANKDEYLRSYQVFRFVKTAAGWRIAYSPAGWDWY